MNKDNIISIFKILKKNNPNPVTELHYKNKFQLLIAVILSAQATDKSVNAATKNLFKVAGTPKKMLSMGEVKLKYYIKTIGLYNAKAKNVIKTCKIIFDNYKNEIPNNREDLEKLPGVGRKTANVVLNNAFGQPTIGVDTHVFRVSNRLGLAPGKNVLEVERKLEKNIPEKYKLHAHHWLIILGRYTCIARKPKCFNCKVLKFCDYKNKGTQ
ncbi:MAG: endonuclease III [Gammaproteobacteria bacterium]|jgi:endonuclease-3|nr:endonuclease III [Gammaproteobacteria bacterium]|tara:strand:+ start:214 stop:849 length:636 start_codon:yes stop_codon:yes gene_type:complete